MHMSRPIRKISLVPLIPDLGSTKLSCWPEMAVELGGGAAMGILVPAWHRLTVVSWTCGSFSPALSCSVQKDLQIPFYSKMSVIL